MASRAVVLLALLLALSVPSLCAGEANPPPPPLVGLQDIPEVIAEVNGAKILRTDLIRELVGSSGAGAIDRLVRRKLVEQGARAANVSVSNEEIEQQFKVDKIDLASELIAMPWEKQRKDVVPIADIIQARFRMTIEEYKQNVIRQKLLVRRCVAKDLHPTDEELLAFYNNQIQAEGRSKDHSAGFLFQAPVKYHASHILISPVDPRDLYRGFRFRSSISQMQEIKKRREKTIQLYRDQKIDISGNLSSSENDPEWLKFKAAHPDMNLGAPPVDEVDPAWTRAYQAAAKVLAEIQTGKKTWNQAVREYSQDPLDRPFKNPKTGQMEPSERDKMKLEPGDVGWFHIGGPLVDEFYEGAKDLKLGQIGGPIKTEYGYHLIRMLEIQSPPPAAFDRDKTERFYLENQIQFRSEGWLQNLVRHATLKTERTLLWPPMPDQPVPAAVQGEDKDPKGDADPVVGTVNGEPLRRNEIWRELIRAEGDDALDRLVNLEVVLGMLKNMGMERLRWECADPDHRPPQPPGKRPIRISAQMLDLELNDDRLRHDTEAPDLSFSEYIYQRFGQSEQDYRRKLEASLVLREAIRRTVPTDDATLKVEFAIAREQYEQPAAYDISHILLVPSGGMDRAAPRAHAEALDIANFIRQQYAAKPDVNGFTKLVTQFSMDSAENKLHGGKMGLCFADGRNPAIPPQVYGEIERQKLAVGNISEPIRTYLGYHIVRIDAKHPARTVDFDEVKPKLLRDYLQERAKMHSDIWLRALTARAAIKRYLFATPNDNNNTGAMPPDNFPLPKPDK